MYLKRFQHDLETTNPKKFLKNLLFTKSYGPFCKTTNEVGVDSEKQASWARGAPTKTSITLCREEIFQK